MREQTISFILKMRLLQPSQSAEGKPILRGSLQQIGVDQIHTFGSMGRLVEILREILAQPLPPVPSAQAHTEKTERGKNDQFPDQSTPHV